MEKIETLTYYVWTLILTVSLIIPLLDGGLADNVSILKKITPAMLLQSAIILVAIGLGSYGLNKISGIFSWSILSLFGHEGTNVNLAPVKIPYFGLVFCTLFLVNTPQLAQLEESWFRSGTAGWIDGTLRSAIFGFAHCLVGVPIGTGVCLSLAGLWYTYLYFIGGVQLSSVYHATYNAIIASLIMLLLIIGTAINLVKS